MILLVYDDSSYVYENTDLDEDKELATFCWLNIFQFSTATKTKKNPFQIRTRRQRGCGSR